MVKQYGGENAYVLNVDWISQNSLFDIERIESKLRMNKNRTPGSEATKKSMENMVRKILREGTGSTYYNVSNTLKNEIGRDIKKILLVQQDIRYLNELIQLRDEKQRNHEIIQNELVKIQSIGSENLQMINGNSPNHLLVKNPIDEKDYNSDKDKELLNAVIDSVLRRQNINTVQDKILGCDPRSDLRIANALYFNRNNSEYHNRRCKYLMSSLNSATCWKKVDLSKHGVGSVDDIAILMFLLVTRKDEFNINTDFIRIDGEDKKCNIYKMFAPYIKDDDLKTKPVWIKPLWKQSNDKNNYKNIFINPSDISGKKIKRYNKITKCEGLYEYLRAIANNINQPEDKKKHSWESYAIFLYGLIKITIESIRHIFNEAMEEVESKYINELNTNVAKTLENLEKLLLSNLSSYIQIKDSASNNNYGFVTNQTDDIVPKESKKKKYIRINGGYKSIKNMINYKPERLLFSIENSCDEADVTANHVDFGPQIYKKFCTDYCYNIKNSLKRLSKFIYGSTDIIKNDANIYMGGFIHKGLITKISRDVFIEFYKIKYYIIFNEYKYLNHILNKLKNNIHIKELRQMYKILINKFTSIGEDHTSKDITAKIMINDIKKLYFGVREKESQSFLELIHTTKEAYKHNSSLSLSKVDEIYIKHSHYKLKAKVLKKLSLKVYESLQKKFRRNIAMPRKILPDKYYEQLKRIFKETDNVVRSSMKDRGYNINSVNLYLKKGESPIDKGNNNALNNRDLARLEEIENELGLNDLNRKKSSSRKSSIKKSSGRKSSSRKSNSSKSSSKLYNNKDFKISKLNGQTIYIPYKDSKGRHGFYDILSGYSRGNVIDKDIIKGSAITVSTIMKKHSASGIIVVAMNKEDELKSTKWRAMDYSIINEFKKMSTTELRKKIKEIFTTQKKYYVATKNYWGPVGNSRTKSKLEKYCKIVQKTEKECDFIINWEDLHKSIS